MNITARSAAVVLLLTVSVACGQSGPTGPSQRPETPSATPTPVPSPTPSPPEYFPPLTGPSRTFEFARELTYPVFDITKTSRFVLYDNGAFVLRYAGVNDYRGRYAESKGAIAFDWFDWYGLGAASGTLENDFLSVTYNLYLRMTDFQDAVYRRVN